MSNIEQQLAEMTERLKQAAGANLRAVVLYGSAAGGRFEQGHSDLNLLCILDRLDAAALAALAPAVKWWTKKRQPPPLVFTFAELRQSADIFAIEMLDIKSRHRLLYGEDCFAGIEVPLDLHRIQLEHELRTKLIRFREAYIEVAENDKRLLRLMTASLSSFLTLFRHALIAFGEAPPPHREEVLDRLATRLGADLSAFRSVLEVRQGKRRAKDLDPRSTAASFLNGLSVVTDKVDRLLAADAGAKEA